MYGIIVVCEVGGGVAAHIILSLDLAYHDERKAGPVPWTGLSMFISDMNYLASSSASRAALTSSIRRSP